MHEEKPVEAETPWAVARRMQSEGHHRDLIVERLRSMGLDDTDIRVLLFQPQVVPAPTDQDVDRAVAVAGARVAAGLLVGPLGSALVTALTRSSEAPPPLQAQVPLAPDDPSARCAWHPELASVASCPRCGAFTCRQCAPQAEVKLCSRCRGSTAERDRRITRVARWVAVWMFGLALAAGFNAAVRLDRGDPQGFAVLLFALTGGPFVVLGALQLAVRTLWPAVLALLAAAAGAMLAPVSLLWVALVAVLLLATVLGRGEINAARRACTSP